MQRGDLLHRPDDHLVLLRRRGEILGQAEKVPAEPAGAAELDEVKVPLQEVGNAVQPELEAQVRCFHRLILSLSITIDLTCNEAEKEERDVGKLYKSISVDRKVKSFRVWHQ